MSFPQMNYQPAPQPVPPYGYNAQPPEDPEGLGSWILTLFVAGLPLIGFIYLLVLAFGSDSSKAKQNFARASLILGLVAFVIMFVVFIVIGATVGFAAFSVVNMSNY